MAMAVFSFAMLTIVTLVPAGLKNYQQASNTTAYAQIVQNITTEVQLMILTGAALTPFTTYYDIQGTTQTAGNPTIIFSARATFGTVNKNDILTALSPSTATEVQIQITSKSQPYLTNYFSTIVVN